MAEGEITRIRSNIAGLNILRALREVNNRVQVHQLRLATGKRINTAGDDPAGLSIATKLDARNRALQQVFNNIGEAKNMLNVAEGGLQKINDILIEVQAKLEQAANDTIGSSERQSISQLLIHLRDEIDSIATETTFNGVKLLGSDTTFTFQTGETNQTAFLTAQYYVSSLGLTNLTALTSTSIIGPDNYLTYLNELTAALATVSTGLTNVGGLTNRLTIKEEVISIQQANTEAVASRIMDADIALEQLNLTKNQILQQMTTAMLAQANLNSQAVLSLFG